MSWHSNIQTAAGASICFDGTGGCDEMKERVASLRSASRTSREESLVVVRYGDPDSWWGQRTGSGAHQDIVPIIDLLEHNVYPAILLPL